MAAHLCLELASACLQQFEPKFITRNTFAVDSLCTYNEEHISLRTSQTCSEYDFIRDIFDGGSNLSKISKNPSKSHTPRGGGTPAHTDLTCNASEIHLEEAQRPHRV